MTGRGGSGGVPDQDAYDWQPIDSVHRDGRIVLLTWMEDGVPAEIWPMRWQRDATNDFFAPGITGMWVLDGGGMTWSEGDPDASPTHWAPAPFSDAPKPDLKLVWSAPDKAPRDGAEAGE